MFGFKKKCRSVDIGSPINGKMIDLTEVPDKVFASAMMGPGVAFISEDGKVYSPCDGKLTTVFPTKHAIGITTENGAEILIHFGLDTVQLNGKYFVQKVNTGARLRKGELILEVDIDSLVNEGYKIETPMIVTNSDDFDISIYRTKNVNIHTDAVMVVEKK